MTPRLAEIAAVMAERHLIYMKRLEGRPGPWTEDPILLEGRFCNVFRELDTVTIWIEENIRKPYADHEYLWFMLCIARYVNWPPTLDRLMKTPYCWPNHPKFDPSYMTRALEHWSLSNKTYTGAYMIRAESDPSKPWYSWSKHKYIAEIVLGRLWEDRNEWTAMLEDQVDGGMTLEDCWALFQDKRYIGWGPFMAYEVVTDLRHTRYLNQAPDIYTWANAGPGAIRGLNRLYGRDLSAKPKASQTNGEMLELMNDLNGMGPESGKFWTVFGDGDEDRPNFEMRDVEHTLCEFDKYERVRLGEGKMRAKYNWRNANEL